MKRARGTHSTARSLGQCCPLREGCLFTDLVTSRTRQNVQRPPDRGASPRPRRRAEARGGRTDVEGRVRVMSRRVWLTAMALVGVVGVLGAVKVVQIQAAIAQASSFQPP